MKNRIITISLKEIKKSYKRFLSLLIMSFLGVAIFVGLRETANVMNASLDKYFDINDTYDVKVVSTMGLTNKDIEELKKLYNTDKVIGTHSKDVLFSIKDEIFTIKLIGYNENINRVKLNSGRLPKKENEIAVEDYLLKKFDYKIGDFITIDNSFDEIKNHKLKIVGSVSSPLYIIVGGPALMRGTTNIGTGQINFYGYTTDDFFDMDYYTEIYLTSKNAKEELTGSNKYLRIVSDTLYEIDEIKSEREHARYQEIYDKLMSEVNKKELEANKELGKANNQLINAKNELDNGYKLLNKNKKELENATKQLNNNLITLNNAKIEIDNGKIELNNVKDKLNNSKNEINELLAKYNLTYKDIITISDILDSKTVSKEDIKNIIKKENQIKDDYDKVIDYIYENNYVELLKEYIETGLDSTKEELIKVIPKEIENYDEVIEFINNINLKEIKESLLKDIFDTRDIEELKNHIPKDLVYYDNIISFLDKYIENIEDLRKLLQAVKDIQYGEEEINRNEQKLNNAEIQYNNGYNSYLNYKKLIEKNINELNLGYSKYYSNLNLYRSNYNEFMVKKVEVEKQIAKAKEDINKLEVPTWYVTARSDNSDYSSFMNIGGSLEKLSNIFPVVFFIVAIFMSTLSMSRMALEDRAEIGTLKALGFSNKHILAKYIIYSSIPTIIGGILGSIFGFYFLTWFIWRLYCILYNIVEFKYVLNIFTPIIGIILSVICITGTTILTVKSIVKENAASLLRPKAPLKGKKIILEHFKIWNKIKFSNKVTVRNIFRYKKRVIMTILGISGCTMLLLTGYGIRDSIVKILPIQFNEIFVYDDMVYLDNDVENVSKVLLNQYVDERVDARLRQLYYDNTIVNVVAFDDYTKIDSTIKIKDKDKKNKIELDDNKIVISSKIAKLKGIKVGDTITLEDYDEKKYNLTVSNIFDNYISHYIFMNKKTYEKIFEKYNTNLSFIKVVENHEDDAVSNLLKSDAVLSVVSVDYSKQSILNMLDSLNNVVYILIVFSGLLSFVVLYNLSYINISERKREIATLKVLGFYDSEVGSYIVKENFIITAIGIFIGLILGKFFVDLIVDSVEIDLVRFVHEIDLLSYIKTCLFMFGFTIIVSIIIHFTLKKVDMIESLKSVE